MDGRTLPTADPVSRPSAFGPGEIMEILSALARRAPTVIGALSLSLLAASLPAATSSLPALAPTPTQARTTGLVTRIIDKQHYLNVPLDDPLSGRIFDRYLESLDPTRSYLLAEDVAQMSRYRDRLDDALRQARLEPAYQIFSTFRARLAERARHALTLLDSPLDFSRDDTLSVTTV